MSLHYDLHSHSIASDGTLSPVELVTAARDAGVDVLALTDHDTLDGLLDAARTAFRLGAEEVNVYYRRSRNEMPVTEVEYDEAVAEGIQFNFLVSPTRIESSDWKATGLQGIAGGACRSA